MCKSAGILIIFFTLALSDKITDLTDKRYVMIETDHTYLYEGTGYLYHVTNLTKILRPYEDTMRNLYNTEQSQEEQILINRIESLKSQLIPNTYREKRALNFLGSMLKFVTGTPDHDDLIEIKTGLNQLIENNNKQKTINSRFEQILETLDPKAISNNILINEVYRELEAITNTINFAKNGNFYSGTLNLNDIKELISNEAFDLPLINILEYSDIHVCLFNQAVVTIYKYPILEKMCKLYNLYPLASKHGKLVLDEKVAVCNNKYTSIEKCKNYIGNNICKINEPNNCTINILENKPAKCDIIQENNAPLTILENGYILTDNEHIWNGQLIKGPKLIQFDISTNIDTKNYFNHQEQIKNAIHQKHDEQVEILNILTSDSIHKFSNIQEMTKYLIPIEQHPIRYTIYFILVIFGIILCLYISAKLVYYYKENKQSEKRRLAENIYEIELARLRTRMNIM